MNFLRSIISNVYDPDYYRSVVRNENGSAALKYFAKLILLLALIGTTVFITTGFGTFLWNKDSVRSFEQELMKLYPEELVIRLEDGVISTNVEEPYAIAIPQAWSNDELRGVSNLIVIDTGKEITANDFETHNTIAIIGRDEIGFIGDNEGEIGIQKFENFQGTIVLDKATYDKYLGLGLKYGKMGLLFFVIFSPIIIFAALFSWYLMYLLFGALFVWLAAKIQKYPMTYGEAYKNGLHLITFPALAGWVLSPLIRVPFIFTFILFLLALLNFQTKKTEEGVKIAGESQGTQSNSQR